MMMMTTTTVRMMTKRSVLFAILIIALSVYTARANDKTDSSSHYYPLLMPDVQPLTPESYLCTAFKMPRTSHEFIVEYLPNATMQTAHHILIYGCEYPGYAERDTPRAVWDCGEMSQNVEQEPLFPQAPICRGQTQIVYSWAMDAPSLKLPSGVGFKVGRNTDIKYLVLQVHYAHVDRFVNGDTDRSGITLRMLPQNNNEINKLAGVLLLETDGRIEPKSKEHFEVTCRNDEPIEIHPFAFRTHTHKLGLVVSGYRVDPDTNQWDLIGKGNPQKPQMFYKTNNEITIKPGDHLAARCTMYNYLDETVRIGSTGNDEMCNFYIMYYVNRMDRILDRKVCFSAGPPTTYWHYNFQVPNRINIEASQQPK